MSDFKASVHKTQLGKLADPLAVFKGPTSEGKEEEEGREGKGRAKGRVLPLPQIFWPRAAPGTRRYLAVL